MHSLIPAIVSVSAPAAAASLLRQSTTSSNFSRVSSFHHSALSFSQQQSINNGQQEFQQAGEGVVSIGGAVFGVSLTSPVPLHHLPLLSTFWLPPSRAQTTFWSSHPTPHMLLLHLHAFGLTTSLQQRHAQETRRETSSSRPPPTCATHQATRQSRHAS